MARAIQSAAPWSERVTWTGLFVFCFACVLYPLQSTDIWWQIHAGQVLLERGFPTYDPFSTLSAQKEWIDLHWLYQLWVYATHSLFGVAGLVICKCLLFSVSALLLVKAARVSAASSHALLPLLIVPLCLLPVGHYVLCRPVVVSLLYLAAMLWILERYRHGVADRLLILLPVIQIMWVNSQPIYPIGLCLVLIYWVALLLEPWIVGKESHCQDRDNIRRSKTLMLGLAWLGMLLACFVNPYGLAGVQLPWQLFFRIDPTSQAAYVWQISENVPTWQLIRQGDGSGWAFVGLSAVAFGSFWLRKKSFPIRLFLLLVAFFTLALMANRNVLLFAFVATFVLHKNLAGLFDSGMLTRLDHPTLRWISVCLVAGAGFAGSDLGISQKAPFRVPTNAATVLNAAGGTGNLFCSVRYGGYLGLVCPSYQPFIDGRLVLTSAQELNEYLALLEDPGRFEELNRRTNFQAVVLPSAQPDRYRALIAYLAQHEKWRLAATDGTEVLFVPSWLPFDGLDLADQKVVQAILNEHLQQHPESKIQQLQARIHLGRLLTLTGHYQQAERVLIQQQAPEAQLALAEAYLAANKWLQARRLLEEFQHRFENQPRSLAFLARVHMHQGNLGQAVQVASDALRLDPYNAAARLILETITDVASTEKVQTN